jgi:CheY-like chemotaxis protein
MSGYGQPEDLRRSEAAGFDRHLTKPVDPRRLTGALRDVGWREAFSPEVPTRLSGEMREYRA